MLNINEQNSDKRDNENDSRNATDLYINPRLLQRFGKRLQNFLPLKRLDDKIRGSSVMITLSIILMNAVSSTIIILAMTTSLIPMLSKAYDSKLIILEIGTYFIVRRLKNQTIRIFCRDHSYSLARRG
ncbi:hypothetical protein SD70_20865 [Gordoniibacillus kamchatkensis]|uniref:ABC transmembrane type-1 domain-containing protein n=1 Tax=Gordoniibacillus kamchatkensis TaxID=1590651 RepID=A0ABR5AEQ6_9BACL|nr:hypothetical protein SD70_20865 [Paenibacillus sp. VKM B-2647]